MTFFDGALRSLAFISHASTRLPWFPSAPRGSGEKLAKPRRQPSLIEPLFGDGNHGVVERIGSRFCFDPVQFEKGERRGDRGSLISIDERLRLRDVKGIRGSDPEESVCR